jgi:hypothetical protein
MYLFLLLVALDLLLLPAVAHHVPHACQPSNEVLLLCWFCVVFMFSTSYVGCEEEIWLGL